MRIAGWPVELALTAILVASAGRAHADPQVEKADQLFAEGKALMSSNLLQACDKFIESLRINPAAIGTLLNVALCDEQLGRIASAVDKFSEARNRAKEQGLSEHLRAAEDHLAKLEPSVPHLTIQLTEPLPDTTVLVEGHPITPDRFGSVPIDPGERVVVVSAIDRLPYRVQFVIGNAEHKTIVVPRLARSVTVTSSWRRIGQITTVTGGVALAAGVGIGIYARQQYLGQIGEGKNCLRVETGISCNTEGKSKTDRAMTLGNIGTVVGALGLVAAGVGGYLWYSSPSSTRSEPDRKLAIVPEVTDHTIGVTALGRF